MSSLLFDNTVNLVWSGDSSGYTRSFTPAPASSYHTRMQLNPYTRFRATPGNPIIHQLNHQRGILSLSNNSINLSNRRGISQVTITGESAGAPLKNLSCITVNSNTSNEVYVGGTGLLSKINLLKPQEVTPMGHEGQLSFINSLLKYLILGKSNGSIEIFDPTENKLVTTFYGHNGLLSDLDVLGTYVATCGYSVRPRRGTNSNKGSDYMVDPLVNIYDLRMMRPLPPIPFPAGASFVRFHPKLPNIIIIASTTGQLQFVDIYDQLNVYVYQANLNQLPQLATASLSAVTPSYLSNLDISENGEYLTFSDGFSNLHLWTNVNNTNKNFINFPGSLEQPDLVMPPPSVHPVPVDDFRLPLSSVGMPYYKDFLLSNFRADLVFDKELLKLPQKIDPALVEISDNYSKWLQKTDLTDTYIHLQNQIVAKFVAYDKAKYGGRNAYNKYESLKHSKLTNGGKKTTTANLLPKFLSEQDSRALTRTTSNSSDTNHEVLSHSLTAFSVEDPSESIFQYKLADNKPNRVPNCYSRLQIQYSKFGIQDFDFRFYNKSGGHCGLENHVDNSYINSLLQLYRFCPRVYNVVTGTLLHEWLPNDTTTVVTDQNPQGSSVLNELGYLFDMMYKSHENPVKISNFSQVLNQLPAAKQEKLLNFDELKSITGFDLQNLIIRFNRFLVNGIAANQADQFGPEVTDDTSIFNCFNVVSEVEIVTNGYKKVSHQLTLDLVCPPQNVLNRMGSTGTSSRKSHTLITFLEYSLHQSKILPYSTSNHHQQTFPHTVELRQTLVLLPPVLSINLPFSRQELQLVKGFKKWLVPEFYTLKNPVTNKITFKPVVTQFNHEATRYELLGYVCEVNHDLDSIKGEHNLVSYIKIGGQWFLFNDFLVMPIPEDEVFNISYSWKKPVVLLYHNVDHPLGSRFNYWQQPGRNSNTDRKLDDSILYRDHFAGAIRESYKKEYTLLTADEAPRPGTLVAIDAEFVTLQPEELEISYDGTRNLVKPKNLSLVRVSVIRGEGPREGVPFIDDYIVHTQPIFDYLTSFSGIEPGDLDPENSTKNLVTLQTAYRRLWLLLNLGCVFVGHGLKNDFRCINLNVPQHQIRDTIDYFYLPDFKRKLSLKFLAFVLLKENVQTGNHDSIEDARTALLLYKRYVELKNSGELDSTLSRIYKEGQLLLFRVP